MFNMVANFAPVDILNLTKLAWDLYHSCDRVAGDAPDGFRQLVAELASLQASLRALRDDVSSDTSLFEKLDDNRKQILDRCLDRSFNTLQQLKGLMVTYKDMGIGDGKQFWQRVKWATQRDHIKELKSKIMVHTCHLTLCMSSIRNSSLERIEKSMMQALEVEYSLCTSQRRDSEQPLSPLTAISSDLGENGPMAIHHGVGSLHGSVSSNQNHPREVSVSSESMISGYSESSFHGVAVPSPPLSRAAGRATAGNFQAIVPSPWRDQHPFGTRGAELGQGECCSDSVDQNSVRSREPSNADVDHTNLMEIIAYATEDLRRIRMQEQLLRPLRVEPQDKVHRPDADLRRTFEASARLELKVRRLNTRDWLRVGTWWLLKARTTLANGEKPSLVGMGVSSMSPSVESKSTTYQAYADLLKASYVLYDVVLKDESSPALLTDENRKLISDLSEVGVSAWFQLSNWPMQRTDMNDDSFVDSENTSCLSQTGVTCIFQDLLPKSSTYQFIYHFSEKAGTYDHRVWKTGLPVRSAVLKPHAGRLVVGWVTTSESRLLYVFFLPS